MLLKVYCAFYSISVKKTCETLQNVVFLIVILCGGFYSSSFSLLYFMVIVLFRMFKTYLFDAFTDVKFC